MRGEDALLMLLAAAVIAAIVVVGVVDCKHQRACEDAGGHVEKYNCTTSLACTTEHNGPTSTTICNPYETCEWRCVGLPAEHP